jgi:transposase
MEIQQLVSPSRQVPTYGPVLVKDFLAKNNVTTLEHPPYSPDFSPADFYPFP